MADAGGRTYGLIKPYGDADAVVIMFAPNACGLYEILLPTDPPGAFDSEPVLRREDGFDENTRKSDGECGGPPVPGTLNAGDCGSCASGRRGCVLFPDNGVIGEC